MKQNILTTGNCLKLVLLALILSCTATTAFGQKAGQTKTIKNSDFLGKLEQLKSGMSKSDVKNLLGEPYKISFDATREQEITEDLYYKTENKFGKWTVIIYQCVFTNDRLVALVQKEYFWDTSVGGSSAPL